MNFLIINIFLCLFEAIFLSILCDNHKLATKIYLGFVFAQMFLLHAFVDVSTITDLPTYVEAFKVFSEYPLVDSLFFINTGFKMEPGWILFCRLLSLINENSSILLIVTSLIIVSSYVRTIKHYSPMPWFSVYVFLCLFFIQSLFVLRQYTAMSLCLISLPYIINRNFKFFFCLTLLACLIHYSAIVFIPLYFLYNYKINRRLLLYLLLVCIIGRFIMQALYGWVFSYSWYASSAEEEGANLTGFLVSFVVLSLYLFSIRFNVTKLSGSEKLMFIMCCCWLILQATGIGYAPTNRLAKYYSQAAIFLVPWTIRHRKQTLERVLLILAYLAVFFIIFLSDSTFVKELKYIF